MGSTEQKTLESILQAIIDQGNLTITEVNTSVGAGTNSLEVFKNIKLQELSGAAANHTITLNAQAQELVKYISEQGFRIRINQVNHGFTFNPIQFDVGANKYVKATINNPADAMAIRVNNDNFDLVTSGSYPLEGTIKDVFGDDLVVDEYYFLDENVAGGFTPIKPTTIYQPLFLVAEDKGKRRALIEVETPVDLEPRILNDIFDEQVERVVNTADEKIEEIKTTQGMKGDKGDKGDTGAVGPQGIQGIQGLKGEKGDTGSQGLKGDKGDKGIQGPQGIKGDTGIQGPIGPQGDKGDKGDAGSLVNIANNEEISLWLGTTADYEAIVEKSRGILYQHFDADGNFAGGYYKRKPYLVTRGLIEHFDFMDGKGTESTLKSRVSDNVVTLNNFNFDQNSGWTGKSLKFDGVDDWGEFSKAIMQPLMVRNEFTVFVFARYISGGFYVTQQEGRELSFDSNRFVKTSNRIDTYGQSFVSSTATEKEYIANAYVVSQNNVTLYRDPEGKIYDTTTAPLTTDIILQSSQKVTIGRRRSGVGHSIMEAYTIYVYDRALTEEEVQQNFKYEQSIDRNVAVTYPLLQEEESYGIGLSNQLTEEQKSTFRLSVDGTKFVAGLRYCEGLEVEEFAYSEIQKEMEKEEWTIEEEVANGER